LKVLTLSLLQLIIQFVKGSTRNYFFVIFQVQNFQTTLTLWRWNDFNGDTVLCAIFLLSECVERSKKYLLTWRECGAVFLKRYWGPSSSLRLLSTFSGFFLVLFFLPLIKRNNENFLSTIPSERWYMSHPFTHLLPSVPIVLWPLCPRHPSLTPPHF